jgi:hypothetical protein
VATLIQQSFSQHMNRKVVSAGGGAKLVVSAAAGGVKTSGQFQMKKGGFSSHFFAGPLLKGQIQQDS